MKTHYFHIKSSDFVKKNLIEHFINLDHNAISINSNIMTIEIDNQVDLNLEQSTIQLSHLKEKKIYIKPATHVSFVRGKLVFDVNPNVKASKEKQFHKLAITINGFHDDLLNGIFPIYIIDDKTFYIDAPVGITNNSVLNNYDNIEITFNHYAGILLADLTSVYSIRDVVTKSVEREDSQDKQSIIITIELPYRGGKSVENFGKDATVQFMNTTSQEVRQTSNLLFTNFTYPLPYNIQNVKSVELIQAHFPNIINDNYVLLIIEDFNFINDSDHIFFNKILNKTKFLREPFIHARNVNNYSTLNIKLIYTETTPKDEKFSFILKIQSD